jgi:chemotaxis signal transduction protein
VSEVERPRAAVSADEMRRRFDGAFAAAPADRNEDVDSFLAMRINGDGYALRVREVAGFAAARKIVPLPSPIAEMLGIAGIRGSVVPVFSLAALLGYARGEEAPRWFVLCAGAEPIALGFRDFDGYLELPRPDVSALGEAGDAGNGGAGRAHVRHVVRASGEVRGVIDVPSVVKAIQGKVAAAAAIKER